MTDTRTTEPSSPDQGTEEIRFATEGPVGVVTLDRPKALNSLTLPMIDALNRQLRTWEEDDAVRFVVLRSDAEKAYCAGGDVRAVWEAGRRSDALTADFFREEYRMNRRLYHFPKPVLALIDGITMGGGVGISVHGDHRIAGDRTMLAMPEAGIGLFTDVGTTHVLARMPDALGYYLGLTGARLKAADGCLTGLATAYVPSDRQAEIIPALAATEPGTDPARAADQVIGKLAGDPGPAPLAEHRAAIARCFAQDSVEAILEALAAEGTPWAEETRAAMAKLSPTSLKLIHRAIRRAADLDLDATLVMEYRLSQGCMAGHDFYEGIRAVLVDKDHKPAWKPATLAEVTDAMIEDHFAEPAVGDLTFP